MIIYLTIQWIIFSIGAYLLFDKSDEIIGYKKHYLINFITSLFGPASFIASICCVLDAPRIKRELDAVEEFKQQLIKDGKL